jgi:hypothetical protein
MPAKVKPDEPAIPQKRHQTLPCAEIEADRMEQHEDLAVSLGHPVQDGRLERR